jgi:uncharacterized protein YqjF (DUF2071 family)
MDVCGAIPFRVHAWMTDVDLVLNYTASFSELVVRKICCLPGSDAVLLGSLVPTFRRNLPLTRTTRQFNIRYEIRIYECPTKRHWCDNLEATKLVSVAITSLSLPHVTLLVRNHRPSSYLYRGADKSLARPGRKQATATEDFEFHISYL